MRVDIVFSDAAAGHTLVDIVVADHTHRDLVERAARQNLVAATDVEPRKETHSPDRAPGTKFVLLRCNHPLEAWPRSSRNIVGAQKLCLDHRNPPTS